MSLKLLARHGVSLSIFSETHDRALPDLHEARLLPRLTVGPCGVSNLAVQIVVPHPQDLCQPLVYVLG